MARSGRRAWEAPGDANGPEVRSLLADLPLSRVAAAFERPIAGTARSLFALCLRALVPFAAVDALVQSRLACDGAIGRVACPPRHIEATAEHRGGGGAGNGKSADGAAYALWWVSCCGCLRRLAADAAPRCDADAYWCGGPCARGWLRRVPTRDALRIVAWHWASVVAARHRPLGEGECVPCRGLYERDWFHVAGHEAEWDYMGPDMSEPDAVVFDMVLGDVLSSSMVPRSEVDAARAAVDARDRVPHPTYPAVAVFWRYGSGALHAWPGGGDGAPHPVSVVALVDGDRQFAGEITLR